MASNILMFVLHFIFFLLGVPGNLLILIQSFIDWRKTRDFSVRALIVDTLGLSNIILQTAMVANELCYYIFPEFYSQMTVLNAFLIVLISLFFSSLLFSVCLCFYYFVKIVQFTHPIFLQLKRRISELTYGLLIGSLLVSLAVGLPSYWDIHMNVIVDTYFSGNENDTMFTTFSYHFESRCHCLLYMYILLSSLAFTIFFFLTLGIIISLCKHMWRIQINNDGVSSIDAHLTAAKTLTALLLLYIYFFAAVSYVFNISSTGTNPVFFYCLLMISSFPLLNSLILIMGNPKLRTSLKNLLLTLCADSDNLTVDRTSSSRNSQQTV